MKIKFCVIAAVIMSVIPTKCLYANINAWPHISYISNSFLEVGLGAEHGKSHNLNLRKWNKPLRIYVEHQIGDQPLHDQLLDAHISQLVKITNFDISRVKNKSEANVYYYFTKQSILPSLVQNELDQSVVEYLHGAICLANVKTDKGNNIISAHIFIPVDQARMHGKLVACIVEELTQSLGLIRDSDLVFPSIFNDKTRNALLTGLDEILLRLLAEDTVKAGMSREELEPILHSILMKYQRQGLIRTAEQRVQEGALYEMLGFKRRKNANNKMTKSSSKYRPLSAIDLIKAANNKISN
ncbi:DUF2927 domain-containing protein [Psychrobium sp. nBUS_13]|uniref:DUF2927 domain-containing protein n=1 Tax=Psychrobium sp. nBUS_13 TaxID=3395319 RepID=UPI003EB92018